MHWNFLLVHDKMWNIHEASFQRHWLFFQGGELGSVWEAGGEAAEDGAASVRVNRKDD